MKETLFTIIAIISFLILWFILMEWDTDEKKIDNEKYKRQS